MSTLAAPADNPFMGIVSDGQGGDFELPPAGQHPAYLVGLIDLGTHSRTYNNKTEDAHKIFWVWELTAEHKQNGETFVVGRDFNWTLKSDKSKLRIFLQGWMGRTFRDGEQIDFFQLIATPCVVNLTEDTSGNGKKFVEVASCARPMRGLAVPPNTIQPFVYSLTQQHDNKPPPIPDWVPYVYGRKVIDEIKASQEWGRLSPF